MHPHLISEILFRFKQSLSEKTKCLSNRSEQDQREGILTGVRTRGGTGAIQCQQYF